MKRLISIADDLTPEEIWRILELAKELKEEWQREGNKPLLKGKTLAILFQKPSLRTRVSFEMAMSHLGGRALYLSPNEVQMGRRESVPDVARVLSRYVDGIVARVYEHRDVEELANYASIPVINGLSDFCHPCQALSDLFTIHEKRGYLNGLKLAYVGDGNNVARSLLFASSKVGMDISVASPEGYEPEEEVVELARGFAEESGGSVLITNDPIEAVRGADIIYTDVWVSMGQEEEAERRLKVFPPYQVNMELVANAKPDCMVMHCLPAHRGQEITDEVADGPNSIIFDQAENRMHAQKGILVFLLTKYCRGGG
jgi:ornithine carbamoyltransferase